MTRLAPLISRARAAGWVVLPAALTEALEARRAFRARGLRPHSLMSARRAWLSRLHLLPLDLDLAAGVVVDVGANEGNFTAAMLDLAPDASVIAAEPSPGPRERLAARFAGDPRVTIVDKALSLYNGTAEFNITAHDHNSSLHEPLHHMPEFYGDSGWSVVKRIEVATTTLDDLVGDRDVSVLKLDVQGGEMDVLRGGSGTLARTRAVLLEVTFLSHYEGDATFEPLHEEMIRNGFHLFGLADPGRTGDGLTTWSDACYARTPDADS
jgi:FkbM family methyltransferase